MWQTLPHLHLPPSQYKSPTHFSSCAILDCFASTPFPQEVSCMSNKLSFKFSVCEASSLLTSKLLIGESGEAVSIPPPQDACKTAVNLCAPCRWLRKCLHVSASSVSPLSWLWECAWVSLLEDELCGAETAGLVTPVSCSVNRGDPRYVSTFG